MNNSSNSLVVVTAPNAVFYSGAIAYVRRRNAPAQPPTGYDDSGLMSLYIASSPEDLDEFIANNSLDIYSTCAAIGDPIFY